MTDKIVRDFSAAGPCLTLGKLVRETPLFWVFHEWRGGARYDESRERKIRKRTATYYSGSHVEPCRSCRDHTATSYPNGYED